jgi:hypothetical protein
MRTSALALSLLALALVPAGAHADGLPVPVDDAGPTGVVSADGAFRYVTIPAAGGTVVERIATHGGQVTASRSLHGAFTIPVVGIDGSPAGLSHDGGTLVLIRPRDRFPRARTMLTIVDARRLVPRRRVTLRGDFSFDALSPDGRTAYLVQYVAPNDATRYLVRALDPATGRLRPHPIVDPHERGDDMRGLPLTRATSPGGRWAYTLYDGAGKHPFVHALDTRDGRARCIDLPDAMLHQDLSTVRLDVSGGGGRLDVSTPKRPLYAVDTATFRVRPAAQPSRGGAADGGGIPWQGLAALGLLLLSAGAFGLRRRAGVDKSATTA